MDPNVVLGYLRSKQLREFPARPTDPTMPTPDPTRLSPADMEKLLASAQGAPIDYSKVQEAAAGRQAAGSRAMLGGLGLTMMGGKSMQQPGQHLFEQALALKTPLRANAADVGYENPETGEFVENPHLERVRQEKVIQGRIDARVKEEEAKARLALAQGNAAASDIAKQNAEMLKGLMVAIAAQNANTAALRAENAGKAATGKPPKPLLASQVKDLEENVGHIRNTERLLANFTDDMSGMGPLSQAQIAAESLAGGLASEKGRKRANWWSEFKMLQELPQRHALFGATLTEGEQRAWNAAQIINPRSDPADVRKAMNTFKEIIEARHARMQKQFTTEGKNTEAYNLTDTPEPKSAPAGGGMQLPSADALDAELAKREKGGKK